MKDRRNITRFDYARTRAWWVRIYRGGHCHSRMFSDSVYGGKRKALAAATKWRDRYRRKLPLPLPLQRLGVGRPYGYVKLIERKQRVDWHPAYVAWVRLKNGRVASSAYSVGKHGKREAKRLADDWLRARLG